MMRCIAFLLIIILWLTACNSIKQTITTPLTHPLPAVTEQSVTPLAQQRLNQEIEQLTIQAQQKAAYADNYYNIARQQYEQMQLETAQENLKLALRFNPGHREAARMLEQIQGLLGQRPDKIRTFYDWARQEKAVKTQQMQLEIRNLMESGKAKYKAREFTKARDDFEQALRLIQSLPYEVDFSQEKQQIQNELRKF